MADKDERTVSVIMPNYNHARFLPGAVKVLAEQSVRPLDIVLVDDGSTDDSVAVMQRLAGEYPCVTVVENGENLGTTASCNRGLEKARGEHLLFAAADDLVLPGLIETGLSWLGAHPEAAMCCRTYLMFDVQTGKVGELDFLWGGESRYMAPRDLADVLSGWSLQTMGTIYDRDKFEAAGGLRDELAWHSDWYVNHVLGFRHGICYLPEPGTVRREHADSYSHRGRADRAGQDAVVRAILDLFLDPAQADLLPLAAQSRLMGFFGEELARVYYADPELWTANALTLVLPALSQGLDYEARKSRIFRSVKPTDMAGFVRKAFKET